MRAASPVFRFAVSSFAAIGCWVGLAQAQPVLDIEGTTLTSYLPAARTLRQDLRPRFDQRGVDIDGTLRSPSGQGWSLAADNLGGGYGGGRKIGDIMLAQGAYNPTDIDLALPTLGPPVMIGRTYNAVQVSGGSRGDSNGYQGWNWSALSHPELVFKAGTTSDLDVVYLVYGADRYIEFKRTGVGNNEFKAKNGAAGVIQRTASVGTSVPELYTYFDQRGNTTTFFGFDTSNGGATGAWAAAQGQLWKVTDAAGQTMYVGDPTTASTAISNGIDANPAHATFGYITSMSDASGRTYSFAYTAVAGFQRLTQVLAKVGATTVGTVDYTYYDGTNETSSGAAGDLRSVVVTLPDSVGGFYVTTRYYRYYITGSGIPGLTHGIKSVVAPEGVRQAGGLSTVITMSDAALQPYADASFEYSSTDNKISKAILNGGCGCAGGSGVTYYFAYDQNTSYSTWTGNTSYDSGLAQRTVITQPDTTYITQYFDEVGQPRARVVSAGAPGGASNFWVTEAARNGSGQVTQILSPEVNSGYNHTNWTWNSTGSGMVTEYARFTTPTNLVGLRQIVGVRPGTTGTLVTLSSVTLNERQRVVGTTGVVVPVVATSSTYPSGSALTTTITPLWWDNTTNTNAQYIATKSVQMDAPAVSSGNNGSGSVTSTYRYLRADGSTAFTQDATGIFFYSGRDAYGNTSISIADVSTSSGSIASGDAASNWSITSSGTAIGATSTYTYDAQGRMTQSTIPRAGGSSGTRTQGTVYTALTDGRLQIMTSSDMSGANYLGPISVNVTNQAGRSELQGVVSLTTAGSMPSGTPSSGTWQRVTTTVYDSPGVRPLESRVYTSIPSSMPGSSGTNYDSTTYGYDSMGRREKTVDPTGTITRTVFETRGLPVATWIGTSDTGFTSSGGGNMTQVQTVEYDGGSPGKNGWATTRTQKPTSSSSDDRVTTTQYDYRGRAILQFGPVSPYSVMKYDDLSRVIAAGQYSSTSGLTTSTDPTSTATNRVGLSETVYDERGQVARTTQWKIIQSSGAKATGSGASIVTDNWYDAAGRSIKRQGSTINKTAYDRLGRSVAQWLLAKTDDAAYGDASGVTGDIVLEESRTALDAASGRPLIQWSISRRHDDTVSGRAGQLDTTALGATSISGTIYGRIQITSLWYDQFDRVTATAAMGTNGITGNASAGSYSRPSSAPSSSPTALVTTRTYDGWGNAYRVTDPAGVSTQTDFDDAGRTIHVNNDYQDGTPGGGTNNDQDRIVEYTYSNGLTSTVKRRMTSSTDDQTTTYTYGVVKTGTNPSNVASNRLLASVVYPPQYTAPTTQPASDRTASYSYNALGQTLTSTDPAGNVITNTYDTAGRVTARVATTVAGTFDGTVNRIETSYDARGKMSGTLQKNSSGTVLDEVKLEFDDWGNLSTFTQDPDSAITGGSGRASYQLTYTYALNTSSGGWPSMKLTQWTQPGSITVTPAYGTSGSIADLTGRINSMTDQTSATISTYSYLGAGTVVGLSLNEPSVVSQLFGSGGSSDYSSYMDPFNRPKRQTWVKTPNPWTGTGPAPALAFVDRTMTYDLVGNMTSLVDTTMLNASGIPNFDALYTFDNLRRLDAVQEGQLNSGGTAITTKSRQQNLARNLAGRVTNDQLDLNGNNAYTDGPPNATAFGEMNDTRTYNQRNELRKRSVLDSSNPSTPRTVTLTYDLNGNMTSDGERYKYIYNPWCQVVQVQTQANVVVGNIRYNGLGMRISEQFDTNRSGNTGVGDGVVDSNDNVFFIVNDMQGRRVGAFRDSDTYPKETFVQHPASVRGFALRGGIILRDRNANLTTSSNWASTSAISARPERNYPATDLRGSTVALVDSAGKLVEQFRYSATGVPLGIPLGDVTGDGVVSGKSTGDDYTLVQNIWKNGPYSIRGDLNLDGVVDSNDLAIVSAQNGTVTGRGKLSRDSVAWRSGWNGMEWQGTLGTYGLRGQDYDAVIGVSTSSAVPAGVTRDSPDATIDSSMCLPGYEYDPRTGNCVPVASGRTCEQLDALLTGGCQSQSDCQACCASAAAERATKLCLQLTPTSANRCSAGCDAFPTSLPPSLPGPSIFVPNPVDPNRQPYPLYPIRRLIPQEDPDPRYPKYPPLVPPDAGGGNGGIICIKISTNCYICIDDEWGIVPKDDPPTRKQLDDDDRLRLDPIHGRVWIKCTF